MGNRSDYLLILLWEDRVGDLLLLNLYSISSSLSRRPRIISSGPNSTRSATSASTTDCRNIRWEKKWCSLPRNFTWKVLGSFGLGLLFLSWCWSVLGRQPTGWISEGDSKMFTLPSTSPSFASTPLEVHMQIHPSQSK